ncbi:MAG: tellurite resistance TerB family protein [Cellvibrionaceae bacterium]|nr:tellurite resistance TerB family protein [Cellvibrionaceae bacterium]
MSIKNLFEQFLGSGNGQGGIGEVVNRATTAVKSKAEASGLPGGLAGGLAAGGIVSLLLGSKQAREYVGTAAKFGGAALLGGAAYKLYQNWQQNTDQQAAPVEAMPNTLQNSATEAYQLTLIKAMIAAAKADGHIDAGEQAKIFETVETLGLPAAEKALIFDLLSQPISLMDIAQGIENDEQKTEVYLASCVVCDIDHPAERQHLDQLARALSLPATLKQSIEAQVKQM